MDVSVEREMYGLAAIQERSERYGVPSQRMDLLNAAGKVLMSVWLLSSDPLKLLGCLCLLPNDGRRCSFFLPP